MHHVCRVLVRVMHPEAIQYSRPIRHTGCITPCPFHKPGDVFICQDGSQPQGLCGEAWHAIGKYAFAFASGGDGFWPGWIEKRNVSINSCNDGLRPVIFKIEPMEE